MNDRMILGTLRYPSRYCGLGLGVKEGLTWLASQGDLTALPLGHHVIDGNNIFVDVLELTTIAPAEALFETHKLYFDIHVTLSGEEWFGHAAISGLKEVEPYSKEQDRALYRGEGIFFQAHKGHFVIFMPDDAYKQGVTFGTPGIVKKLILKVKI